MISLKDVWTAHGGATGPLGSPVKPPAWATANAPADTTDQQGLAEVHLAKHRNGPTGNVKLSFLKRFAKFADLAA